MTVTSENGICELTIEELDAVAGGDNKGSGSALEAANQSTSRA
jgi:hypothetical protein